MILENNRYTIQGVDVLSIAEKFGTPVYIYEAEKILSQYQLLKNSFPCCIRLNPHIEAGGHSHIQTGHIDSKFGISIYQLRHVLRVIEKENILVEGLHMHTGSDILDSGVFLRGAELLFEAANDFK